jgi:nicotinate phosphoribosyltransferase
VKPDNGYVRPLLTDLYEITMAYAYFKAGKHKDIGTFDLFFRKNPFGGEFTIYAGLSEVLNFIQKYKFSDDDIDYICSQIPECNQAFKNWLSTIDCSQVKIYSLREGNVAFPRVPLMRVEGPLGVCQLLESTLLNLVSYPSLVATNAIRMKLAAGANKKLVEFGLRRAQGPDGAVSASHYSYLGGFEGTSNMMAGYLYDIPVSGTQAHSYISSFTCIADLKEKNLKDRQGKEHDLVEITQKYRVELGYGNTNEGELAAFIAYAQSFPDGFLALVDTYDTLESGLPNFLCVALALSEIGYKPVGIRLDSGDLSHLSRRTRQMFTDVGKKYENDFAKLKIVASNEINEETLRSLGQQGHEIDIFGIGTHLVTCQKDPSLGCVYKLVQVNEQPKIKLSEDIGKLTFPARKEAYRLIGEMGYPLLDIMIMVGEQPPEVGKKTLCCHPFEEAKRTYVIPSKVISLHKLVWDGKLTEPLPSLDENRQFAIDQVNSLRKDHIRPLNPTPYKVSFSEKLFHFVHDLWRKEAPIREMR